MYKVLDINEVKKVGNNGNDIASIQPAMNRSMFKYVMHIYRYPLKRGDSASHGKPKASEVTKPLLFLAHAFLM